MFQQSFYYAFATFSFSLKSQFKTQQEQKKKFPHYNTKNTITSTYEIVIF